ncbi:MAG: ABC transporter ATP-binding protein [Solirubrobacteraceae bacterium]
MVTSSAPPAPSESNLGPGTGLTVEQLTKVYPNGVRANDGISLHVAAGEIFGLLGPNGAGKSTLVQQVIGLLKPTAGRIELGRFDLVQNPDTARQLCSYLPQAPVPIDALRLREAIELSAQIRGMRRGEVRVQTDRLIDTLQLREWERALGSRLSGGVRRLVGFAMAAVQPGALTILDEPTNDVDPLRRRLLWDHVRALADAGVAVLLVTHNVIEAEKSVDRLAVIDQGKVIAEGTPSSLKSGDRGRLRVQVMLAPGIPTPETPAFVERQLRSSHTLVAVIPESAAADGIAWAQQLLAEGLAEEYALGATTLEDVYIRMTGRVAGDDGAR